MTRLAVFLMVAACGGSSSPTPDAAFSGSTVYLNFEGQAINAGSDSALTNTSSVAQHAGTITAMYMADPQRTMKIASITSEMTTILAPYAIQLVTTRPSSGDYDMIVFGGTAAQIGLNAGIGAVTTANCGYATPDIVSFVFDVGLTMNATHNYTQVAIGMLAFSHGVDADTLAGDCLCLPGTTTNCGAFASACTFAGAGTAVNTMFDGCAAGKTMFDPNQQMLDSFGAHP